MKTTTCLLQSSSGLCEIKVVLVESVNADGSITLPMDGTVKPYPTRIAGWGELDGPAKGYELGGVTYLIPDGADWANADE